MHIIRTIGLAVCGCLLFAGVGNSFAAGANDSAMGSRDAGDISVVLGRRSIERTTASKEAFARLEAKRGLSLGSTPEDAAQKFVTDYSAIMTGSAPAEENGSYSYQVRFVRKMPSFDTRNLTKVVMTQYYRGLKVLESMLTLFLNEDGSVYSVTPITYSFKGHRTEPLLSPQIALSRIQARAAVDSFVTPRDPELVLRVEPRARLVYIFRGAHYVGDRVRALLMIYVDADTGEELARSLLGGDDSLPPPTEEDTADTSAGVPQPGVQRPGAYPGPYSRPKPIKPPLLKVRDSESADSIPLEQPCADSVPKPPGSTQNK